MGRTQRALTSLVAAIPAGFLGYLLVMVFLNQADSLSTTMQAVVGATLLTAGLVALMPFILLIPGRKAAPAAAGSNSGDDAVEVMDDGESGEIASGEVDLDDSPETSDYDLGDSDADVLSDSSAEFDTQNNSSLDDIDAFDMDDDDEPPAKKRK